MPWHGMAHEAQKPHEGEEGLARRLPRSKSAVQLEGGERGRRRGETEVRFGTFDADAHERIQERECARHVTAGSQLLDETDLPVRCGEGGVADLPRDARS